MSPRLAAAWRMWLVRQRCQHHWHPANAMILWECCRCGADRDGMPTDKGTCVL